MLSVKEAQQQILNLQVKIKTKKVPVLDTLGLVLAKDIISDDNIPAYDNSAMDGYAVKAEDILGADKNYPVKLNLLKEDLPAGKVPCRSLESGYAMSIMTGAPIPQGCSCVVMREDTQEKGHFVLVFKECREGENIRYRGEDIKKGDKVLKKGKVIYPGDIGVMASIGKSEVPVIYPPLLGIMTTGNELLEIDSELTMGKVRDSNSYSLAAQVKEVGAYYKKYGIVRDEKEILGKKITEALAECDILLLTGGVSVGNYDFVKEVLGSIGAQLLFWGVNQRPGKPLAFLTYKDKFIFGLPGNPVSVMVCFEMYVRPLIKKMMGIDKPFRNSISAKSSYNFEHKEGRTDFVRVIIEKKGSEYFFKSTGTQGSGVLTSMSEADGIAIFPEHKGNIKKNDDMQIYLLKE